MLTSRSHRSFSAAVELGFAIATVCYALTGATVRAQLLSATDTHVQLDPVAALEKIERLAREQVVADSNFLGRVRFLVEENQKRVFRDLTPVPLEGVLSPGDVLGKPLEGYIRVLCLERDFQKLPKTENFWRGPLMEASQAAAQAMGGILASTNLDVHNQLVQEFQTRFQKSFKQLQEAIDHYAELRGLAVVQVRGPPAFYQVKVLIEPAGTRVRYMPRLAFLKCKALGTSPEGFWEDLFPGKRKLLGGYHYRVEWPAQLGGWYESDFEIYQDDELSFSPPKKESK